MPLSLVAAPNDACPLARRLISGMLALTVRQAEALAGGLRCWTRSTGPKP